MELKRIVTCLSIVGASFVIVGGLWTAWNMKADASEVKLIAMRLEQKITNDTITAAYRDISDIQQRIWETKMYAKKLGIPLTPEEEKRIMEWEEDINMITVKIKLLEKSTKLQP